MVSLVGHPVVTGHAVHLVLGVAADEDIVAAFADHFVEAAAADKDVVARHIVEQERIPVVAGRSILHAGLDPVVAFVAGLRQVHLVAENEVVAGPAEDRRDVFPGDDEVLAVVAQDDVADQSDRVVVHDDVVAGPTLDVVVAALVLDDVVAVAAEQIVVAEATVEVVVAGVAPDRVVVGGAGNKDVIASRAAQDDWSSPV